MTSLVGNYNGAYIYNNSTLLQAPHSFLVEITGSFERTWVGFEGSCAV